MSDRTKFCRNCEAWAPMRPEWYSVVSITDGKVPDVLCGECRIEPPKCGSLSSSVAHWPITQEADWCLHHRQRV
jgi:hypothetical protein